MRHLYKYTYTFPSMSISRFLWQKTRQWKGLRLKMELCFIHQRFFYFVKESHIPKETWKSKGHGDEMRSDEPINFNPSYSAIKVIRLILYFVRLSKMCWPCFMLAKGSYLSTNVAFYSRCGTNDMIFHDRRGSPGTQNAKKTHGVGHSLHAIILFSSDCCNLITLICWDFNENATCVLRYESKSFFI